jgi:citrate lyase subunit beta/citryl-CoA lyase
MPASNARALAKAKEVAADVLVFDLEDAVAPDAKPLARAQAVAAAADGGYGRREIIIRINALATLWGADDVVAVAGSRADGLLVPKIETAADVAAVERLMALGGAAQRLRLWVMLETPRAILQAESICSSTPRLAGVFMGNEDLAKDMGLQPTPGREALIPAMAHCLLAARAAGIAALDGVHVDLGDEAGLLAVCRQGRMLGFDGKSVIHPKQIDAANRIFAPTDAELAWARRIVDAHAEGAAAGKGLVVVDGRMIERLHVERAQRTLAVAAAIAERDGQP